MKCRGFYAISENSVTSIPWISRMLPWNEKIDTTLK